MDINLEHVPIEFKEKVADDLAERYVPSEDIFDFNLDNDWDLHLYALTMNQRGITKDGAMCILLALPLIGVPKAKRNSYIGDVLNSIIVGYNRTEKALPVYAKIGGE